MGLTAPGGEEEEEEETSSALGERRSQNGGLPAPHKTEETNPQIAVTCAFHGGSGDVRQVSVRTTIRCLTFHHIMECWESLEEGEPSNEVM